MASSTLMTSSPLACILISLFFFVWSTHLRSCQPKNSSAFFGIVVIIAVGANNSGGSAAIRNAHLSDCKWAVGGGRYLQVRWCMR